jgi:hypothetical protein
MHSQFHFVEHALGEGGPRTGKEAKFPGFPNGFGGEGGIRTPDRLAPMPHFECGAFDHSATSPGAITERLLASRSGRVLGEDGGADKRGAEIRAATVACGAKLAAAAAAEAEAGPHCSPIRFASRGPVGPARKEPERRRRTPFFTAARPHRDGPKAPGKIPSLDSISFQEQTFYLKFCFILLPRGRHAIFAGEGPVDNTPSRGGICRRNDVSKRCIGF